jgi:hypothetical protein
VVWLHENGTQSCVAPGLHRPAPSQAYAPTTASPLQLPGWHWVPAGYFRQFPEPSQVPSSWHVETSAVVQVLAMRGGEPFAIPTHFPIEAVAVQVWQPDVQAVSQHTPSTQKLLVHWAFAQQTCPFAFFGPLVSQTTWSTPPPSPVPPSLPTASPTGASGAAPSL